MKRFITLALLFLATLPLIAQGIESGVGKPWDIVSLSTGTAAGAVAALLIEHLGKLIIACFDLWTARVKQKMPTSPEE